MAQQLPIRYWLRRYTRALWDLYNPIVPDGDIVYSTDTLEFKVGDGQHQWSDLPSVTGQAGPDGDPGPDGQPAFTYVQDATPSAPSDGELWVDGDDPLVIPTPPSGGTTGQALKKTSNADYAYAWSTLHEVPAGGTINQILRKIDGTDYNYGWYTLQPLPAGGSTGQVLTKLSGADGDAGWSTPGIFPFTRTYSANQLDGIFAWLGTGGGTKPWAHPAGGAYELADASGGQVAVSQSSNQDGTRTADKAIDHNYNENTGSTHTTNAAGSWWKCDFGASHTVAPTYVAILGRAAGGQHLRNWKVQGSNNNSTWTDLLTVAGAGPNDGTWYSAAITGAAAYRYLRILQTGANGSGADYMTMGEIEFWGVMT